MKNTLLILSIAVGLIGRTWAADPQTPTAKTKVAEFYQSYLGVRSPGNRALKLPFSKSFESLIAENAQICKQKADKEVCGFGANGDVYLNAQEIDPQLNWEKARVSVTEALPGKVNVAFNVYPSAKDPKSYDRSITYLMVLENGEWVVDDIVHGNESSRVAIEKENTFYKSRPQ
jgi:hypothetical protein